MYLLLNQEEFVAYLKSHPNKVVCGGGVYGLNYPVGKETGHDPTGAHLATTINQVIAMDGDPPERHGEHARRAGGNVALYAYVFVYNFPRPEQDPLTHPQH